MTHANCPCRAHVAMDEALPVELPSVLEEEAETINNQHEI